MESLLERPPILAVRRTGQRIALLQEFTRRKLVRGIRGRIEQWGRSRHVTMTVESEGTVPVRRHRDGVIGPTEGSLKSVCSAGKTATASGHGCGVCRAGTGHCQQAPN